MRKFCVMLLVLALAVLPALAEAADIYAIPITDAEGKEATLEACRGKVLLIVNTATKCGFTPQYEGLEALYEKYRAQGFEVLDFPCNQFLGEAPGTLSEINSFCALNYNTQFPRFEKIEVNGPNETPLYTFLKSQKTGDIRWNFTKFLISRDGEVLERFEPTVTPEDLEDAVVAALG